MLVASTWYGIGAATSGDTPGDGQSIAFSESNDGVDVHQIQLTGYNAPISPAGLVYRADAGFEGEVTSISSPLWSTPTGTAPDSWTPGEPLPRLEVIYRTVTVRVTDGLLGGVGSELTVAIVGGSLDNVEMVVEDPSDAGTFSWRSCCLIHLQARG